MGRGSDQGDLVRNGYDWWCPTCREGYVDTACSSRQLPPDEVGKESITVVICPEGHAVYDPATAPFDSRPATYEHITYVRALMLRVVEDLLERAHRHDYSKLEGIEREAFDRATPWLKGTTYGSEEYRAALHEIRPAVEHHYRWQSVHAKTRGG